MIIITMMKIHHFSLEDVSKIWGKNHTSVNIRYKIKASLGSEKTKLLANCKI